MAAALKMNLPGFYWTHIWRAAIYGQLGRTEDGKASVAALLNLYPTISDNARLELTKYNVSEAVSEHIIEGLRKAGLRIADAPKLTD